MKNLVKKWERYGKVDLLDGKFHRKGVFEVVEEGKPIVTMHNTHFKYLGQVEVVD